MRSEERGETVCFGEWAKKLMRKKKQLKTKGGESKEREKKERSRIQVETFLFVKITY